MQVHRRLPEDSEPKEEISPQMKKMNTDQIEER